MRPAIFEATRAAIASIILLATALPIAGASDKNLSILSFNVYFLSIFDSAQNIRAQRIVEASFTKAHDVLVFQECFERTACNTLINGLRPHYPYFTSVLGTGKVGSGDRDWTSSTGCGFLQLESGGVVIMSKWPILEKHQYIYKAKCGIDALAKKGVVYVKLDVSGSTVHVVGTHAQANDAGCAAPVQVRASQLAEMHQFIADKNIPAKELVLLSGDMNVDRNSPDEYQHMLEILHAQPPLTFQGHAATWDPQMNELARATNANHESAHYIDYVLIQKGHILPKNSTQTVLSVKASAYKIGSTEFHDFSDHFAVHTTLTFEI